MKDMPSNSDASKTTIAKRPTIKPVAKGTLRRRNALRTIGSALFDDSLAENKLDLRHGIVEPTLKNMTLEMISALTGAVVDAFEMALFPDSSRPSRSRGYSGWTSYGARYRDPDAPRVTVMRGGEVITPHSVAGPRSEVSESGDYFEVFYEDAKDEKGRQIKGSGVKRAAKVLTQLNDVLGNYPTTSRHDLFYASSMPTTHQDFKWVWSDLTGVYPIEVWGGAVLRFPRPEYRA